MLGAGRRGVTTALPELDVRDDVVQPAVSSTDRSVDMAAVTADVDAAQRHDGSGVVIRRRIQTPGSARSYVSAPAGSGPE
ncbi:MAG: hypothetical protein R2719_03895 [Micropruina sp.]